MSEERFNSTVEEIKKIFLFLTEQEPSPDDEIEAREKLIDLFKNLKNNDTHLELDNLIEEIIDELNKWDTLDLWFKEVKELVSKIRKIVNVDDTTSSLVIEEKLEDEETLEPSTKPSSPELDISEIVAQVADQFKGQIENLKGQIEQLQDELEKKSESINQIPDSSMNEAQEETFESIDDYSLNGVSIEEKSTKFESESLNKEMKLAPPRVRIPPLKEPGIAPKVQKKSPPTVNDEPELTPLPQKVTTTPEAPTSTSLPEGELTKAPKLASELKFEPEIVEEPEKTLSAEEQPVQTIKKARKIKISSEVIETSDSPPVSTEESSKPPDLTPVPELEPSKPLTEVDKLESFLKDTEKEDIGPIPAVESSRLLTEVNKLESLLNNTRTTETVPIPAGTIFGDTKEPKKISVSPEVIETPEIEKSVPEKPFPATKEPKRIKIESKITETPETTSISIEEDDSLPFNLKKPSISLEDIDDESLQTSRSDLFDVFSSVGGEIFDKSETLPEPIEIPPEKDKKKKGAKKKEKQVKPSKKDEKKLSKKEAKKEAKKSNQKEAPSPTIFGDLRPQIATKEPDIPLIDISKLPKDKDTLYQDLIALEGKRYSLERSLKQLQQDLVEKTVDEHEFENRSSDLKAKMKKISQNINSIRKSIAKLK